MNMQIYTNLPVIYIKNIDKLLVSANKKYNILIVRGYFYKKKYFSNVFYGLQ